MFFLLLKSDSIWWCIQFQCSLCRTCISCQAKIMPIWRYFSETTWNL